MKTKIPNNIFLLFIILSSTIMAQIEQGNFDLSRTTNDQKIFFNQTSSQKSATIAYAFLYFTNTFISIPIPGGTPFTFLNPHTFTGFPSTMCKGGDGKYYLIEYYYIPPIPDPLLYEFNPTGDTMLTLIGSISGLGTDTPYGLAFNPKDNSYYICTGNALYSFDLGTRTATFIGYFGLSEGLITDLSFNNVGVCFGIKIGDWNSNSFYACTIDVTTAVPTILGPLGYNAVWPQSLSYDYETNIMYVSATDHLTYHGQLRTMDQITGSTTVVIDWGEDILVLPFEIDSDPGILCQVGAPSDPDPSNGSTNVGIMDATLSWTNGTGTINVEVWFGEAGNVLKVYDGVEISSLAIDTLSYSTTYNWKVICKNDTCTTSGPYWTFLTESDSTIIFYEPFNNLNCWTPIGPQGFENWLISNTNNSGGSPTSEVKLKGWDYNAFNGLSQLISCPITDDSYHYIVKLKHMLDIYSGSSWQYIGVAVSYDGGITKQIVWQSPITGNMGPEEIETEFYPSYGTFQMILYFNGVSLQIENWYVDDLILIDDCMECFPPAAPSNLLSFHYYNPRRVLIYWQDNSWNEEGFEVFRKNGFPNDTTQYQLIGSVLQNNHNYWDYNIIIDSTYTYRVLAYNQFGNSDTSVTTTITIPPIPVELTSFSAESNGNEVVLNWSTATELNNQIFEIQRKTVNQEFYTIGYREGHGTTTEVHNYTYTDKNVERGKYFYRLKQIDYQGTYQYSNEIEVDVIGILEFDLSQNYPNPFNPSTVISYQLPVSGMVTLKLYDILGNEVATLVNEEKQSGTYEVEFNVAQVSRPEIASGIYFYQLKAGNFVETKKMILLR